MSGRRQGVSVRLTITEEACLRSFCEQHKITLSEGMRMAVSRLSEQDRREQLARQVGNVELGIDDLHAARLSDREALRRSLQLLVVCTTHNQSDEFKAQALNALQGIFPEQQTENQSAT